MLSVEQLQQWVALELKKHASIKLDAVIELSPLPGDAGSRQYFRVNSQPALLAVAAPPASGLSDSAEYFSSLSSTLRHQGVPTPTVLACDTDNNCLLIECFEGDDLYDGVISGNADLLYGEALLVLLRLQQIPHSIVSVAEYNKSLLLKEMNLFRQWFVGELLAYAPSIEEEKLIAAAFDFLADQALSQPQVLVHRDYHSRNLIYREAKAPGVIDFQDAVWGPITYDLVSLLRDCYIRWPPERVRQWAMGYGNMAYEIGLLPMTSSQQFLQWFDTMGLQRHIKVLGVFARLSLRDGKHGYLNDLPLVIRYVLEIANQYPQTQVFASLFEEKLLPLCVSQAWYNDYASAGDRE